MDQLIHAYCSDGPLSTFHQSIPSTATELVNTRIMAFITVTKHRKKSTTDSPEQRHYAICGCTIPDKVGCSKGNGTIMSRR